PDIQRIRRPLEAMLPDDLYALRRGTTDSELIFLLLLTFGLSNDPASAVDRVLQILIDKSSYGSGKDAVRLTCVFSDGRSIYAFRHASDDREPTLYLQVGEDGAWTLASEPLDGDVARWMCLEPDVLVQLEPGKRSETKL
ncbi:unnamed protein product, partial [Ectocarpus sp. 12 AP-2014]